MRAAVAVIAGRRRLRDRRGCADAGTARARAEHDDLRTVTVRRHAARQIGERTYRIAAQAGRSGETGAGRHRAVADARGEVVVLRTDQHARAEAEPRGGIRRAGAETELHRRPRIRERGVRRAEAERVVDRAGAEHDAGRRNDRKHFARLVSGLRPARPLIGHQRRCSARDVVAEQKARIVVGVGEIHIVAVRAQLADIAGDVRSRLRTDARVGDAACRAVGAACRIEAEQIAVAVDIVVFAVRGANAVADDQCRAH